MQTPPPPSSGHGWRFAVDRGGTFTDVVGFAPDGSLHAVKVLSAEPGQPRDPALRGIAALLDAHGDRCGRRVDSVRLGTTVATNALLERRGARTAFATSDGFADALAIGYQQRPDIFARAIHRPAPLYAHVCAVPERITADGTVLTPLDETALRRALVRARDDDGCVAVAIAFLHGFRHPAHERRAAELARTLGFEEVVASHEAAPLLGFVARGDTTVADAYLSPVLLRYTRAFRASLAHELGCTDVSFMQSNGGLVDGDGFRGVNGVLSGPAGGVVGMIAAGRAEGPRRLIGFDMGGTSTDVSLSDGGIPRRFSAEIDGVRLQTPLVDLQTIAAGGGSVLRHADGRLQVGPASAGADPGPACYRRGGPATVTDCNVVLGRIPPARFPHVFGASGREPIDVAAARDALGALGGRAVDGAGRPWTVEALASAFLDVAVARMANAIRELALQRGQDPADHALMCFGGAAGQHACAVAELLEVRELLLHPLGGVLSAYGIGLTCRRAIRRRSFEDVLEPGVDEAAGRHLAGLDAEARAELRRQGVDEAAITTRHTAEVRLAGSDTPIELDWQGPAALRAAFFATHHRLYGFADEDAPLVIATLGVEALEHRAPHDGTAAAGSAAASAAAASRTPVFFDGAWHEVPLLDRATLGSGARVRGPVLLCEDGATSWVAPGWAGEVGASGLLVLRRHDDPARGRRRAGDGDDATPDPLQLEVFNALFMHVAGQMGAVLRQTASSVNIKERLDFSCALFDADANLVANAPHMPVHLGSMGASVAAVLEASRADLRPGDAWLVNSPYAGGTHLPDLTVVSPVFDATGRTLEFLTASRAHHADVGGITPGSMPPHSRSIEQEGALIAPVRIVRGGVLDEARLRTLLCTGPWPARNFAQNLADLRAQLAANARGAHELGRAAAAHGRLRLLAYMRHVQDNAEACMRRAIRRLHDGRFRYELDNGQAVVVRIAVDAAAGTVAVDFTGTSAQQDNNFNAPRAVTVAAVLYVFRTLIDEPIPLNAGCLRPIAIEVPRGSMLDPLPPAAVVAGNVETSQCIVDALYGALGLQAASQGTMNNFTFGDARHQYYETIAGGAGAGPDFDGASGVQTHMTNSRLTDPEVLETRFPVLLREFSFRRGSGGAGRRRGGDGLVRRIEFREAMTAAVLSNHRRVAPFGLEGGKPGATGRNALRRRGAAASEALAATFGLAVEPGDQVEIETPGGGGFGVEDV